METTSLLQSGTTNSAAPSTDRGRTSISSDFETFLRMLTAQMTNQDPLDPMDSADFAVQLATFSGVEQQVQTNELLKTLSSQLSLSGLADMAGWVGKEARAPVPTRFSGAPITLYPSSVPGADRAELVVSDVSGNEVQRLPIPASAEPIDWAGVGPSGSPLPPGIYSFDVMSYAGSTLLDDRPAEVYAPIREVRREGGEIVLLFESGGVVAASRVSALRSPAA